MKQYFDAKRQYRHALLFFRMGDFYEMFYEDALVASRALDLTLTSRSKDSSGTRGADVRRAVPRGRRLHRAPGEEGLPRRDLRADRKSEDREGRRQARRGARGVAGHADRCGVSGRQGAGVPDGDRGEPRSAVAQVPARRLRRALVDLSTGEFDVAEYSGPEGLAALRIGDRGASSARDRGRARATTSRRRFRRSRRSARRSPRSTAGTSSSSRRGRRCSISCACRASKASASNAARPRSAPAARWSVTFATRRRPSSRTCAPSGFASCADGLQIDPTTLKHLEIVQAMDGGRSGSLLDEIDRTVTPMGCRLLRTWLLRPLTALEPIRDRLDAVEELAVKTTERGKARETLKSIQDLERSDLAHRAVDRRPARPDGAVAIAGGGAAAGAAAERMPGAAAAQPDRRARRPAGSAAVDRSGDRRRAAGAGARRRLRARRFRPGSRRAAAHQPIGQAGDRRDGRGRARPAPASRT